MTDFFGIVNHVWRDAIHHLLGRVPEHPFGAGIKQLDDALVIRCDDRKVSAGQNRILQRPRFQQRIKPTRLDNVARVLAFGCGLFV